METIDNVIITNEYNKRCAQAVRTLKLFVRNAQEQHETKLPISTIMLVLNAIEQEEVRG